MSGPPVKPQDRGSRRPYHSAKRAAAALKTRNAIRDAAESLFLRDDEAPATLSERPEWRAVMSGPIDEVFARFAALNAALMTRTAAIIALAESAAASEPELREHRDRAHTTSRADLQALAAVLKERGALAAGISEQDAADIMYALVTDVTIYLRLTTECGWNEARYADLIARTLKANIGAR